MSEENVVNPSNFEDVKSEVVKPEEQNVAEKMKVLEDRLQKQSAILGKLENAMKKQPEVVKEIEPKSEINKFSELEEKIKALEAKNLNKIEAVKKSTLANAIVTAGIEPEIAIDFADFISYKNRDKIVAEENELGEIEVKVKISETETANVNDWIKMYISSDAGKLLSHTKRGGSVKNVGKPANSSVTELNSMSYAQKIAEISADKTLTPEQKKMKFKQFKLN